MVDHIKVCVLSGQALDSHDPIIQTPKGAYGVKAHLLNSLTESKCAEIEAQLFGVSNDSNDNAEHSDDDRRPKGRDNRHSKGTDA